MSTSLRPHHQAPLSMGFPRQGYWSGLLFPSPGDLPNPGTEPMSPSLQADSSLLSCLGSPSKIALLTNIHYSLVLFFSSTSITVCNYINFLLTCWLSSPLRCNLYGQKNFCLICCWTTSQRKEPGTYKLWMNQWISKFFHKMIQR